MDLHTGELITRMHCTSVPITQAVITAVEKLADKDGMSNLKITNRRNEDVLQDLVPADWTAGVDYDYDSDDSDDDDEGPPPLVQRTDYLSDDSDDEEEDEPPPLQRPTKGYESDSDDEDDNVEDPNDEGGYDQVDPREVIDLTADEDPIPIKQEKVQVKEEPTEEPTEPTIEPAEDLSTRLSRAARHADIDRLTYTHNKGTYTHTSLLQLEMCHNLLAAEEKPDPSLERQYNTEEAPVLARIMMDMNVKYGVGEKCFGQQYMLNKGLKLFGDKGKAASGKELKQLHDRLCFAPKSVAEMTPLETARAVDALMFLSEKRDGTIKGRMVYNGKPTREWLSREESASPTAALESIFLTAIVDAKEGRDVMTNDVPNAFIQTPLPPTPEGAPRVMMKITGVLVDLLVEMAPDIYGPYVVYQRGKKVLYVEVLQALYGQIFALLLWYRKFRKDLEGIGFVFNPYDACVANRKVDGKQHTVRFHVDDLMSSHVKPKVNDGFNEWLDEMYGKHGKVSCTRGPVHDYLGMSFDFSEKGKVLIDMGKYIESMVNEFPVKLGEKDTAPTPAAENLFAASTGQPLSKADKEVFHTYVAKGLFACKRARPDIHTAITGLCTRVKSPTESDWEHLLRLMKYLNGTKKHKLVLSADDLQVIKWYVDAAFAVHPDFKSHTGGTMSYGKGTVMSMSRKQKLNTRSSTEAELVGVDDMATMILWTKLFMEAQGYAVKQNILYQDNKSTILLENNGKKSSSQRTRAINIRYFFITDQIEKGNVSVEYCPTKEMDADYMSKPLQGSLFEKFRKRIMGH